MYNFKKRIGLAIGTANPNDEDIQNTATGLGGLILRSDLFDKIQAGANNNSLQNFDSFVVTNPDLVDEGIDVSGLRTTTPTRQELLSDIPEFSGIKFDPTQKNYVSDLYALYSGGLPSTSAPAVTTPVATTPSSTAGGGSGGGSQVTTAAPITTPTQPDSIGGFDPGVTPGPSGFIGLDPEYDVSPFEFDDYGTYDPPSSDSFLVSGAAGGASLKDIDLDQVDLGNPTGDPRIVPEEQETEGPPYGINPTTGRPYETPRTIADQNAVLGQTFEQQKDPGFWETARDNFVKTGEDIGGFFQDLGGQGIDIGKLAGTTLLNIAGKAALGIPLVGTALNLIGGALPPRDPRQTALDDFYETGAGAQYMDPSSPNYIPGMENYNTVSGGGLNMITGGKYGDPTTYGLQGAYQDRIDTVENTLKTKYNMTDAEIADVRAGSYTGDVDSDLLNRLNLLEEAKAAEKGRLDLFSGDINPEGTGDGSVMEKVANAPTVETIDSGVLTEDDDDFVIGDETPVGISPTNIKADITSDQINEFSTAPVTGVTRPGTGTVLGQPDLELENQYEDEDRFTGGPPSVLGQPGIDRFDDAETGIELDSSFDDFDDFDDGTMTGIAGTMDDVLGPMPEPPAPTPTPSPPTGTDRPGGGGDGPAPSAPQKATETASYSNQDSYESAAYDRPAPSYQGGTTQRPGSGGGGGGGGGGGCFLADTLITMADGSTKEVQKVDLGDNVAEGGKVFATGKFLVENLHDYKGIKVSGSHMVNEDNTWVRVEDSKHGKPLGDNEHTVYVFGSENRRILINGILFTDYFETTEQEKLINDEKDFFNNWKTYENKIDQDNINILNAS